MGLVRVIAVRDSHGDTFQLFEFHDRRFLRSRRRMKLETGEAVEEVDGALIVASTGEALIRL